ncbi:MAG TPA: carboxyl transferase domain-containing protein, partial [Syntrophales bacterium]|nr:carboxyl transferase domain-containing protein [Syntrophales bacterium]
TMAADLVFAWPTAEMAIMGAEGAAEILYKREIEGAEDKAAMRKQKIDEYREKFSSPYHYAGKMVVDFLIKPRDTRAHLFRALEVFKHKKKSNVDRGHGNIPL